MSHDLHYQLRQLVARWMAEGGPDQKAGGRCVLFASELETILDARSGHRHLFYWCPNCSTTLHLETAEDNDDDARNVSCVADVPSCPMCGTQTEDFDTILAFENDKSLFKDGTWAEVEAWRAKLQK